MMSESFISYLSTIITEDNLKKYLNIFHQPLKKSITINPSKIPPEVFEHYAIQHGWILKAHPFLQKSYSYYIDRDDTTLALGNHRMHQCGYFYIQEIAAATPAYLIDISPGMIILDIAASPGGKTSQIANQLLSLNTQGLNDVNSHKENIHGLVVANDVDAPRIHTLKENLRRMGCRNTAIAKIDGKKRGYLYPETFDVVLVDAPCSGEGTAFKSDDTLKHRKIQEIKKIAGLQKHILESAIHACKPGGQIIYSTCTLNTIENEGVLGYILQKFTGSLHLEFVYLPNTESGIETQDFCKEYAKKVVRFWPHLQKTGGFFVSKLRKITTTTPPLSIKKSITHITTFFQKQSSPYLKIVTTYLRTYFGISINKHIHHLRIHNEYVYLGSPLLKEIKINLLQAGIHIGKIIRETFIPSHHLATTLGHLASKQIYHVNEEELQCYTSKQDILLNTPLEHGSFVILMYMKQGVGIAKVHDKYLKSKFEI